MQKRQLQANLLPPGDALFFSSLQSLYTVVDTAKYFILKKTLISHNIKTRLPNIAWVPLEHLWQSPDLWWRGSFWTWSVVN